MVSIAAGDRSDQTNALAAAQRAVVAKQRAGDGKALHARTAALVMQLSCLRTRRQSIFLIHTAASWNATPPKGGT